MTSIDELDVSDAENYRRQLEAVCDNATVSLFIMDERQQCTYMNPAAEQLTGFTLAEVQDRPLHYFVHHTRPDGTPYPLEECPIDRALPQNNQEQGEDVFVHKDGSFYPVAFTASPLREGGVAVGTVIEVRDTTGEKRAADDLRRAAEQQVNILDRIADGFVAYDREWRVTYVNRQAAQLVSRMEKDPHELIGKNIWEEFPDLVGSTVYDDYHRALAEQMVVALEFHYAALDIWLDVRAYPSPDGLSVYFQDVTERKRAEHERHRLQQEFIDSQQSLLAELSTPLIPIRDGIVVMPLIGSINSERASQMIGTLLKGVVSSGSRVAILDVTGVHAIDTHVADTLMRAARSVRLLGAEVVITGIRAGVAQALVGLGVELHDVKTSRDLKGGIKCAEELIAENNYPARAR